MSDKPARPTGPTGPDDPTEPTKSTEPTAPTGPMGSGVPGGGADRSDDPVSKPGDNDFELADEADNTEESDGAQSDGTQSDGAKPRRMHNMRGLDDPGSADG